MKIQHKQDLLLNTLVNYYKSNSKMQQLVNVVGTTSGLSLRAIDYLCTGYAKHTDVVYYVGNSKKPFNLYLQYQAQLKAYSKLQFDPFRRHSRISIDVPKHMLESGKLETTVAQLNFFRWAIDNKILDYMKTPENIIKIEQDMNSSSSKKLTKKSTTSKSKIDTSEPKKGLKRHNFRVTVTFQ